MDLNGMIQQFSLSIQPQRFSAFLPWRRNPGPTIPTSQLSKPALEQRRSVLPVPSTAPAYPSHPCQLEADTKNHPTKIVASVWFNGMCVCVFGPGRFEAALQSQAGTHLVQILSDGNWWASSMNHITFLRINVAKCSGCFFMMSTYKHIWAPWKSE